MDWRASIYYPLGLLPSIFFTLRFIIQWLQSEKRGVSYVTPLFWQLSLSGNLLLLLHYAVQIQYPFAMIQASNAVISWRNLNLLGPIEKRCRKRFVILMLLLSGMLVSAIFYWQGEIFRVPTTLFTQNSGSYSIAWHLLGTFGGILFASRFWVQWWQSENAQESHLGRLFWFLSIVGTLVMLVYFIKIQDPISILNCSFGLIPYIRNLMLLRKTA